MVGPNGDLQLAVKIVQLGGNGIHDQQDAGLGFGMCHYQALTFGHEHGHQLPAAHDQGGEFALLLIGQCARLMSLGVQHGSEGAQGLRVDAVGLGEFAHAAGEVAGLARVDHRDPKARRSQRQGQLLLVATRRLEQHQARCQWPQQVAQLSVSSLVIAQVQSLSLARHSHVEAVLGDIDPYINRFTHCSSPAPSLTNTKCVRSTIRDAAEQRDHHRAPFALTRARAPRRHRLRSSESTGSAIKTVDHVLTTEVWTN
jgi:hypothetical protein